MDIIDVTIIVALVIAGGGIATQTIIAAISKKSTTNIINYRVGELEAKVLKHNNLIERMYACEESVKSAHHRITELREEEQKCKID